MDTKKLLWMFVVMIMLITTDVVNGKTALRKKPKIYNALITTDENLVQSRAYPVIQPTIHESGIAHYPVGPFSSYGYYNPHLVRFGQPIAPNLSPKEQLPYHLPQTPVAPQIMGQPLAPQPQPFPGYPLIQAPVPSPTVEKISDAQAPPTAPALEESSPPTRPPPTMLMAAPTSELAKDPNQVDKMPSEKLPIPLNQYGLPPTLIPLRQQYPQPTPNVGPPEQPVFLPPYGYQPFPPMYRSPLPNLRQPYLPHYGYLPNGQHFPLSNTIPTDKLYPLPPPAPPTAAVPPLPPQVPQLPIPQTTEAPPIAPEQPVEKSSSEAEPSFENIKNGSKSPDSNVPDVPPPPIPSGAKSKQQ